MNYQKEQRHVINSKPIKRLADKTQVIPSYKRNAQMRTRLTHSLEVMNIAYDIAVNISSIKTKYNNKYKLSPIVCGTIGLLHDIGMCPMGHLVENLLNKYFMGKYDLYFEANANNLLIIEKDLPLLNDLTKVSIIKYPYKINTVKKNKGLYEGQYEKYITILNDIIEIQNGNNPIKREVTFECEIMEMADDIAYLFSDAIDMISLKKDLSIDRSILLNLIKKYKITKPLLLNQLEEMILNKNIDILEELREEVIASVKYSKKQNKIIIGDKDNNKLLLLLRDLTWNYFIVPFSLNKKDELYKVLEEYFDYLTDYIDKEEVILENIKSETRKKEYLEQKNKGDLRESAAVLLIALSELTDTYLLENLKKFQESKK